MLSEKQVNFLRKWCGYDAARLASLSDAEARTIIGDTVKSWERNKEIITTRHERKPRRCGWADEG